MGYAEEQNTHVAITKDGINIAVATVYAFNTLYEPDGYWIITSTLTQAIRDMLIPGGKEIAEAVLPLGGATVVTASALEADSTLAITFEVKDKTVRVHGCLQIATCTSALGVTLSNYLTDELNNHLSRKNTASLGNGFIIPGMEVWGKFTDPGEYTVKYRVAGSVISMYCPVVGQNEFGGSFLRAFEC